MFSSTVNRTALVSRFLFGFLPIFFRTSRKIFLPGLSKMHSMCPQDCFHGKHLLWKKHFSKSFTHFGWRLSRFSRKDFQHVVRTALDSRFLFGFFPTFFGLHGKIYRLVCRNCILRVHRIAIMGIIFFEIKTLFKIYSAFWMETFQVFGESFPARSQDCIGFQVFNWINVNFFRTLRNFC